MAHGLTVVATTVMCVAALTACDRGKSPSVEGRESGSVERLESTPAPSAESPGRARVARVPHFDHVVVVVLENHAYGQIVANASAPFLTHLARTGMVLTQSFAVAHPSQPNYLALFSGSTQGVTDDSCPQSFHGPNLATALAKSGHSFIGYSEDLPYVGSMNCSAGAYARKHNPWSDFVDVPPSANQPMTAFPVDHAHLPSVSFVIPNLNNDLHDGTVAAADAWLDAHLHGFVNWATRHNSLLIVTTDEDDHSAGNHIFTLLVGAHVRAGESDVRTNHYSILRTILDAFDTTPFEAAASTPPVTGVWTNN